MRSSFSRPIPALISRENRAGRLPFHFTTIGRWWSRDAEIDIVATDPSRTKFLVGECKFKDTPFDISEMEALARFAPDKRTAAVHYYLFSKSGFADGVKKRVEEQGIRLVGLDDML